MFTFVLLSGSLGGNAHGLLAHTLEVGGLVSNIGVVGVLLCRTLQIGIVEQILNAQKNLLNGNCWLPILLFVYQRQAHRARWINVGVKKTSVETAFGRLFGKRKEELRQRVGHHKNNKRTLSGYSSGNSIVIV